MTNRVRPSCAKYGSSPLFVWVEKRERWAYAVGDLDGLEQLGEVDTREEAYACAMATLRGMIALDRLRRLAR